MNLGGGIKVDADGYVAGAAPWVANRPTTKPIPTYPAGRRCACGSRLSIYNEDDYCAPCSKEPWADH